MGIRILSDSTSDLPVTRQKALGIEVIPLSINVGSQGFLDGIDMTRSEFYQQLPHFSEHPSTGTPSIGAFQEAYQRLLDDGADQILSIHISESLSGTVNVARQAAANFPAGQVLVRDSGQLSMGIGFQIERAAEMANNGATMEAITQALDQLAPRCYVAARLDTLEFLRRSGRMNAVMTGLGSLLQIKPILTMVNGQPGSERVRTNSKADALLIDMLEGRQPIERLALLHSNAAAEAQAFKERIEHLLPTGEIYSMEITPVLGVHIGPNAVGYAIVGALANS